MPPTCYLSGMDWAVGALDGQCKSLHGSGLCFQICLDLTVAPSAEAFAEILQSFTADFPALNGRPGRAWNLAPYWRMPHPPPAVAAPPRVKRLSCASRAAAFAALEAELALPFESEHEHLRFTLAEHPDGCLLGALFDHRLFDAKGGEAFLRLLDAHGRGGPPLREIAQPNAPSHLNHWGEKFRCGRQVNRAFIALSEKQPPRVLPPPPAAPPSGAGRGTRVRCVEFSTAQTEAITARAGREAGFLMLMPFALAFTVATMHRLFQRRGGFRDPGYYIVPVTVDTRSPEQVASELLFNHLSFFMFKASTAAADDFPALLDSIKLQFYAQVKDEFPRALAEASHLMRIVPMPVLNRLLRIHLRGEVASFCCSYLGASPYAATSFLDLPLRHIVHQPAVPPPGLGLFFQPCNGRLNAILAHADGLITDAEAEFVLAQVRTMPEGK